MSSPLSSNLETIKALEHLAACMRGALNGKASGHVDMHICALDAQVVQRAANLLKPPDETPANPCPLPHDHFGECVPAVKTPVPRPGYMGDINGPGCDPDVP